ncbi:hypothetical protein SHKM778_02940 [Streptomyces sp. KM77-8]|uniref:Uncharacterized protein n=1 Tax=Streptomyces haneummycinicus TaxID=3074435 RepID=A0AAT9H958_9ACTN
MGNHPVRALRRTLTPTGTLVANGGGSPGHVLGPMASMLRLMATDPFTRHHLRVILPAAPSGPTHQDLLTVTSLLESGHLVPVTDRAYPCGRRRRPCARWKGAMPAASWSSRCPADPWT